MNKKTLIISFFLIVLIVLTAVFTYFKLYEHAFIGLVGLVLSLITILTNHQNKKHKNIRNECEALFISKQYEDLIELAIKLEPVIKDNVRRSILLTSKCYSYLVLDYMDEVDLLLERFANKKRYIPVFNYIKLLKSLENKDIETAKKHLDSLEVYKLTLSVLDKDLENIVRTSKILITAVEENKIAKTSKLFDSSFPIVIRILNSLGE